MLRHATDRLRTLRAARREVSTGCTSTVWTSDDMGDVSLGLVAIGARFLIWLALSLPALIMGERLQRARLSLAILAKTAAMYSQCTHDAHTMYSAPQHLARCTRARGKRRLRRGMRIGALLSSASG